MSKKKPHLCPRCSGDGVCRCRGQGCMDCNYSGKCPTCKGAGWTGGRRASLSGARADDLRLSLRLLAART